MSRVFYKEPPKLVPMLDLLAERYTHAEIGRQVGCDGDTIGDYIRGKRKRIDWPTGWKIQRLFIKTFGRSKP